MGKRNTKAGRRLRQLKSSHRRFKQRLSSELIQLEELVYNQCQAYQFLARSVLALAEAEEEPDVWIIGALVSERQLRQQTTQLTEQIQHTRQWCQTT